MRPIGELHRQVVPFRVRADFSPSGDQPITILGLKRHIRSGEKDVVLLGATETGKTATVAWLAGWLQCPILAIQPNKALAVQPANELRQFSPDNVIEYLVSYYDYHQPEVYAPQAGTYIERDSSLNGEVERLRHFVTSSLLTCRDCIVAATVSTIYGLGTPQEYLDRRLTLWVGEEHERSILLRHLVSIQYNRNDLSPERGNLRVCGDVLEIFPIYEGNAIHIEFSGDEVEHIPTLVPLTGEVLYEENEIHVFLVTHCSTGSERMERIIAGIEAELAIRLQGLEARSKPLETQWLQMRTNYNIEMIRQISTYSGIGNYSRHIDGHAVGSVPTRLLDYLPEDSPLVTDESHVMIPQAEGMYEGDTSRRRILVERGFRLPSALDNRPLKLDKFCQRTGQTTHLSATPDPYELERSDGSIEQIVQPTGLANPGIALRLTKGRIDDLIGETRTWAERNERVLVTILAKRMAEDLANYLVAVGIRTHYLHPDIDTLKRVELLCKLRLGGYNMLVDISLLREDLDLPGVPLVAVLDADKGGFLRSERPLIQTTGHAVHNIAGQMHMYTGTITPSIAAAIDEINRRHARQLTYNTEHGVDPQSLRKRIINITGVLNREDTDIESLLSSRRERGLRAEELPERELTKLIDDLTAQMHQAVADLQFKLAARHHDEIADLKRELRQVAEANRQPRPSV